MRYCIQNIILYSFIISTKILSGQNDVGMYFFHELPQSAYLNPARHIPCKIFIGLPILTSIQAGYDNSLFTYHDIIINTSGDSISPHFNFFLNHSHKGKIEFIRTEAEIILMHLGYRYRNYSFSFFIRDRIDIGLQYPINLIRLPLTGNTPFISEKYRMDGLRAFGIYLREWAFGITKTFNSKLTGAIRLQILFGKANLHSKYNKLYLYTNTDIYQLKVESEIFINASPLIITLDNNQLQAIEIPSMSITSFLLNSKNKGIGLSGGLTYQYSQNTLLEISFIDIGIINWKYVPVKIKESASFEYSGFEFNPATGEFNNVEQTIDSALQSYTLKVESSPYFTALNPIIFFGGVQQLYSWLNVGLLIRNELYHKKNNLSVTPSLLFKYKRLGAELSNTFIHRNILNPGLGLYYGGNKLGIYAFSDNIYGIFKYKSMQFTNIRFGFNLFFGCPKNKMDALPLCPAYENPVKKERLNELKRK